MANPEPAKYGRHNPKPGKFTPERSELARRLSGARKGGFDYFTRRGIWLVSLSHWLDMNRTIRGLIEAKGGVPVRVLDIGCGSGRFARQLSKRYGGNVEVIAMDVRSRPQWKRVKGVSFRVGHVEDLEGTFPEGERDFDLVTCTYSSCYAGDQLKALDQIQRVTADGGLIVAHFNDATLRRNHGTDARSLGEQLGARVTKFPPIPMHPIYSLQFRKKPSQF